jgi:acrylyl-CoA reductase (NADPH)
MLRPSGAVSPHLTVLRAEEPVDCGIAGNTFRALVVRQAEGTTNAHLDDLPLGELPAGDVRIRVTHSSLNYKDGLAVTGEGRVIRSFPMIPGIDLAGVVEESVDDRFRPGELVFATGWGLGEDRWGGFAGAARVPAEIL